MGADRRRIGSDDSLTDPAIGPIKLVIGFSPGSASHRAAAEAAPRLQHALERPVTLVWEPGEGGARAARLVANSAPDGETLLVCTLGTHALRPHLCPPPGYDPARDFSPVAVLMQAPLVLATSPATGFSRMAQLIEAARDEPDRLAFASSASGGAPHLAAALFAAMAGISMRHVVYDDTRRLYADLESGTVAISFNNLASMSARLTSGALIGLAVTSATRRSEWPDLPTVAEAGLPGYEVTNWVGLAAPATTPGEAVARLARAVGGDSSRFAAQIQTEQARWRNAGALLSR